MRALSTVTDYAAVRVAVLVDLPRGKKSGGHVKFWERVAGAAAELDEAEKLPFDLTVFFSGDAGVEALSPSVRLCALPPVFSTKNLGFLPYTPDSTDLASYHAALARRLSNTDVVHTTDGYFAYAKTAVRVAKKRRIPLTTSFHTDTIAYTEIFTGVMIDAWTKYAPWLGRLLVEGLHIPRLQARGMEKKLKSHILASSHALASREEDRVRAVSILGDARVHNLRLGVDKNNFGPHRRDVMGLYQQFGLSPKTPTLLFVGRIDVGKNVPTLIDALERVRASAMDVHLLVAGEGPMEDEVKARLGRGVTMLGYVPPHDLGRLYASVDGLALCSEVEIRSMAAVEALATSCPILVSEKSAIAPLFNNTPAMRVVGSGAEAWADAIADFVQDAGAREAMRQTAAGYAARNLASWQDVLMQDLWPVWQRAVDEAGIR